mmetsp:Transcript_23601/g.53114  ORF Transcript_23601/g.53114 Transcript_23601/m.53114 type:complete len:477 (+) Transcript_23601:110-1540(+)
MRRDMTPPRLRTRDLTGTCESSPCPASPTSVAFLALGSGQIPPTPTLNEAPLITGMQGGVSSTDAAIWMVNIMIGSGVLNVPYGFKLSGYSAMVLLCLVILATSFTAKCIGHALQLAMDDTDDEKLPPAQCRDYVFLAHKICGDARWVPRVIAVVTFCELYFAMTTFMVMNAVNANALIPEMSISVGVFFSCAATQMLTMLPPWALAAISHGAAVCLCMAAASLVASAAITPQWALPSLDEPLQDIGETGVCHLLANMARTVGLFVFCFAGHPCFPLVRESMARPQKEFPKAVNLSFLACLLYYGGLGLLAYAAYGDSLQVAFTLNIGQDLEGHPLQGTLAALLRPLAKAGMLFKVLLQGPSIANAMMSIVCIDDGSSPDSSRRYALCSAGLFVALLGGALFCRRSLAALASLTGSLLSMTVSVFFPSCCLLALSGWRATPGSLRVKIIGVLIFGTIFGITGTAVAVKDILTGRRQ